MVRWNNPKDLLKTGFGSSAPKEEKKPTGTSDVVRALVPGQLAKKTVNNANTKLQAVVKGLKK